MDASKRVGNHRTDWQVIGELEIAAGTGVDGAIHAWLLKVLNPLKLPADFFERFLRSVRDSAVRAVEASVPAPDAHIHISILVPYRHDSTGRSWGFFQIERIETKMDVVDAHIHAIDFYLYVDDN